MTAPEPNGYLRELAERIVNQPLPRERPCAAIVDDDALVSAAMASALKTLDIDVICFASAAEFADAQSTLSSRIGCTLIDLRLAEACGIEIVHSLARDAAASHRPNIVISGYADVNTAVEAMALGCWTVLQKPIPIDTLREVVTDACGWSGENRLRLLAEREAYESWKSITEKEKSTIALTLEGLPNKAVATKMGVSIRTVENRRRQIFSKLGIKSVAQLGCVVAAAVECEGRDRFARSPRSAVQRIDAVQPANAPTFHTQMRLSGTA